jgi:tRNAmet cytidine acetate ligase
MKIVGLITEYNPFHNGHLHHIQLAKKLTGADYVVVVMSGNFLQRGTPAIVDKYKRTHMALLCGADLVVELPCAFATASAEFFASGAVSILNKMGCVDYLCFGSECGDIDLLGKISDILAKEPKTFKEAIKSYLKEGLSFPVARKKALLDCVTKTNVNTTELEHILSEPNNILAIEYMKAIKKQNSLMEPITIKRIVSGYHDTQITDTICSASAIRKSLQRNGFDSFKNQVPACVNEILTAEYEKTFPIYMNDFSSLLKYKLLLCKEFYTNYLDVSDSFSHAIANHLSQYKNAEDFMELLKNKQYTLTRINRSLTHILLNIEKETMSKYVENDYAQYIRILGFNKNSSLLLTQIRNHATLPIISKLADYKKLLNPLACYMLEQDIFASDIYNTIVTDKFAYSIPNEFRQQIVILK